mgnify:CR=1 FL=1
MKIFGIGTDIVNIKRIEQSFKKKGNAFKNRIFSKKEISYCEKRKNPSVFRITSPLIYFSPILIGIIALA